MDKAQDKVWLVKSAGRVLGPVSAQQVAERLATREFTIMDEISKPCGRWAYIRDEAVFAKIVQELRFRNTKIDDDTTQALNTPVGTQTLSLTDANSADDMTAEIPMPDIQDAVYQSFERITENPRHQRSFDDVFVYEGDSRAQKRASAKWMWVLTAVIGITTLMYIAFNQFVAKPIQQRDSNQQSITAGLDALEIGNYKKALDNLRQAHETNSEDRSIFLPLAILEIQVGNETVKGLRLLDRLKGSNIDSKRLLVGRGLAALKDGEYSEAEKHFDQALRSDSLFAPALVNLGAAALYLGEPQRAIGYLQMAVRDGSRESVAHLMSVEALAALVSKGKERPLLQQSLEQLARQISAERVHFRQKIVAQLYGLKLLQLERQIPQYLPLFLDAPVANEQPFKTDLYVHNDRVNWERYGQWCLEVLTAQEPTASVVAAEALCLFHMGDLLGASRKMEDAVAQAPRDRLIHAVYAALLLGMSSPERAEAAVQKALQLEGPANYQLPLIVAAQLCDIKGNHQCAKSHWEDLLKIRPNSLYAHSGLAKHWLKAGEIDRANRHIEAALNINSKYIGALQLKEELVQARRRRGF